jgi:hypothetical protein
MIPRGQSLPNVDPPPFEWSNSILCRQIGILSQRPILHGPPLAISRPRSRGFVDRLFMIFSNDSGSSR